MCSIENAIQAIKARVQFPAPQCTVEVTNKYIRIVPPVFDWEQTLMLTPLEQLVVPNLKCVVCTTTQQYQLKEAYQAAHHVKYMIRDYMEQFLIDNLPVKNPKVTHIVRWYRQHGHKYATEELIALHNYMKTNDISQKVHIDNALGLLHKIQAKYEAQGIAYVPSTRRRRRRR